jgi:hypothetical protein
MELYVTDIFIKTVFNSPSHSLCLCVFHMPSCKFMLCNVQCSPHPPDWRVSPLYIVVGLAWSNDPESYAVGCVATGRASHARKVRGDDSDLVLQVWLWAWQLLLINICSVEKLFRLEWRTILEEANEIKWFKLYNILSNTWVYHRGSWPNILSHPQCILTECGNLLNTVNDL